MKYYRNKADLRVTFSSIKREIHPGKVALFVDKELEDDRFQKDVVSYTNSGYLEEVEEGAPEIVFPPTKSAISVIVPKDAKPQEFGKVVLPQGVRQEQEGHIVTAGKLPGQGEVKTVSDFIGGKVQEASKAIEDATKDHKAAKKEVKDKKPIPEDLKAWFKLRHAQKKIDISKMTDLARLKYIAEWDDKVRKLVDQRLTELK